MRKYIVFIQESVKVVFHLNSFPTRMAASLPLNIIELAQFFLPSAE